jgi:arylsulfatase A-like enzyme
VLLVTLDTTRADHLGCYGHAAGATPHLDALAEESIRFDRALATAGLTPMSHASMLTGRNPYAHGLRVFYGDLAHRLPNEVPSLPEILSDLGWRTAAFVSAYPVSQVFGLDRGYQTFSSAVDNSLGSIDPSQKQRPTKFWVDARQNKSQRRSDATCDAAMTWLEEHAEDGPWHLWVHLFDVHDFSLVPPVAYARAREVVYHPEVPPNNLAAREALYDFELEFMDGQFGRLIEWLKRSGQYDNTIVLVVGDHGQGLMDGYERHGWPSHRLLYDWSLRVPFLAHIPANEGARFAGAEQGLVVHDLVRTTDILPTVLELLDLALPAGVEGRSLLPILRSEMDEPRVAYADALNLQERYVAIEALPEKQRDDLYAVVDLRWKLIHHKSHPEHSELFDLQSDPLELVNVIAEFPEEARRLYRFFEEHDAFRKGPLDSGNSPPNAAALGDLGYSGADSDAD